MRRVSQFMFVGLVIAILLAGCNNESDTATVGGTNTPQLAPTAPATIASETSTPSSHPVATNTPSSNTHPPTKTPTPTATTKDCGLITANISATATTTTPSNPQPLEDCFTNAFVGCHSATLAITFIDSTGKTADGLRTPDQQGGCEVASVEETKFAANGSITSATFTCMALVPYSGQKYSLRECSNNEWISLP